MITFKRKLNEVKEKIKNMSSCTKTAVATAVGVSGSVVPAFASEPTTPLINVSGVDFMAVLDEILALVPVLLPVIIGFIAFRKGFAFLKSSLRGA